MSNDDETGTRARIVGWVCQRIAAGESIAAIFRKPGKDFPSYVTFWRWLADDPVLDKLVHDAQLVGCSALEDRILDVARESRIGKIVTKGPKGTEEKTADMVDRSRLEVDALKWILAKRLPKRYGDRTILAGDADNPVVIEDHKAAVLRGITPPAPEGGEGSTS